MSFDDVFSVDEHTTHDKDLHQHCVTCDKALKDGHEVWQCNACKEKKPDQPQPEDFEFTDRQGRSNVGEEDWNAGAY